MKALLKLLFGVAIVAFIGAAALLIDSVPGSARSAEAQLRERLRVVLETESTSWATVEIDGQKALISGTAPSEQIRQSTIEAIRQAAWNGGFLVGGVTVIDQSALVVAAVPDQPVSTQETDTANTDPVANPDPIANNVVDAETTIDETVTNAEEMQTATTIEESNGALETQTIAQANEQASPEPPSQEESTNLCINELQSVIEDRGISFVSARADIDAAGREQLRKIADAVSNCPRVSLDITGHADTSGNAARNRQLSGYRADAVRAFLVSIGISSQRVSARGMGSSEPLVSNATPAGRARNRRIEIDVVVNNDPAQ